MTRAAAPSRYAAFVSYAHRPRDRRWARWIARDLETWRTPPVLRKRGVPERVGRVFRDEEELAATHDLPEAIQSALRESSHLVVICSPASRASRWVNEEVAFFRSLGKADHILPVLVEGSAETARPEALGEIGIALDLRSESEPSVRYRRRLARWRLAAPMLGGDPDELQERDQARRTRRLVVAGIASLVLAAVAVGLAFFALDRQAAAEDSRQSEADRVARAGALAQSMAEDLIDRLRQLGRLDLMRDVSERLHEYYQTLPSRHASPVELERRALVLRELAYVRSSAGHIDEAFALYADSREILESLIATHPAEVAYRSQLADVLDAIALVHKRRGELELAIETERAALREAEHVVSVAPEKNASLGILAVRLWSLSGTLRDALELDEAEALLERALDVQNELISHAETPRRMANLADIELSFGDLYLARGDLSAAMRQFETVRDRLVALIAVDPGHARWKLDLSLAHNRISNVESIRGDLPRARDSARRAREIMQEVADADPINVEFRGQVAALRHAEGAFAEGMGLADEAFAAYDVAVRLLERCVDTDPARQEWARSLASVHQSIGSLLAKVGQRDDAIESMNTALTLAESMRRGPAPDALLAELLVVIRIRLVDLYVRTAHLDLAEETLVQLESDVETFRASGPKGLDYISSVLSERAGLHAARREFAEALQAESEALAIRRQLVAQVPDHVEWRSRLQSVLTRHASCSALVGDQEQVLTDFRSALEESRVIVAHAPTSPVHRSVYYEDLRRLGERLLDDGQSVEGEALFRELIEDATSLDASTFPLDTTFYDLARAISRIGELLGERTPADTVRAFDVSTGMLERLCESQPDRLEWKRRRALDGIAMVVLASNLEQLEQAERARTWAVPLIEDVLEQTPDDAEGWYALGVMHGSASDRARKAGRGFDAEPHMRKAIAAFTQAVRSDPSSERYRKYLSSSWSVLAGVLFERGDDKGGTEAMERAMEVELGALDDRDPKDDDDK